MIKYLSKQAENCMKIVKNKVDNKENSLNINKFFEFADDLASLKSLHYVNPSIDILLKVLNIETITNVIFY